MDPMTDRDVHVITRGDGQEEAKIRFVYLVEGELCVGDVADYAHAWETAYYGGLEVSPVVWVWGTAYHSGPEVFSPSIEQGGFDHDDFARTTITISVGNRVEVATVRIDGRA